MNLRSIFLILIFLVGMTFKETGAQSFKAQQARFARVQTAIAEKEATVKRLFADKRLAYPPKEIFLRAFKREQVIELWVKDAGAYHLLKEYAICAASGGLGPKRRQGDNQVPEGFYTVERFNPMSNFHLSLGLSYPNEADRILGMRGNLGGDIFIHGNCVSIGCMAIQDEPIKELYLIAVEAKSAGQAQIPVHVFPARMHEKGMKRLAREAADDPLLLAFWRNLKEGYDVFEIDRRLPVITVDRRGRYIFK